MSGIMGVNDFSFFAAIDKMVREQMVEFETRLLPVFRDAAAVTGVSVVDVPIEGIYTRTPELIEVYKHLKALHNNWSEVVNDSVKKLHFIYNERDVFGLGPGKETMLNGGENVVHPKSYLTDFIIMFGEQVNPVQKFEEQKKDLQKSVIAPMYDTLALALEIVSNYGRSDAWSIQKVMKTTEIIAPHSHLVSLATLVDRKYKEKNKGVYNPVATTMAAETTVGTRMPMCTLGASFPNVSDEVEELGMKIIQGYNKLFLEVDEGKGLWISEDVEEITELADEISPYHIIGRCVRIATNVLSGEQYHWAIVPAERGASVYPHCLSAIDFRKSEVITTDVFRETIEEYCKLDEGKKGFLAIVKENPFPDDGYGSV